MPSLRDRLSSIARGIWELLVPDGRPDARLPEDASFGAPGTPPGMARGANWRDVMSVVAAFERHGVSYTLVGGYALNYNGLRRHTGDVDVLVDDEPANNAAWIEALCEVFPDMANEFRSYVDAPFSDPDDPCDFEIGPGTLRIIGEFPIDVMPATCGLTLKDLRPHVRRVRQGPMEVNVLDLGGLRLTKQGVRLKDRMDLQAIEVALSVIGDPAAHAASMSRRRIADEPPTAPGAGITMLVIPEDGGEGRRVIARSVLARALGQGGGDDLDVDTLATYCSDDDLIGVLAIEESVADLRNVLEGMGVTLPRPGMS